MTPDEIAKAKAQLADTRIGNYRPNDRPEETNMIRALEDMDMAYKRSGQHLTLGDIRSMSRTGSYGFGDFLRWAHQAGHHADSAPISYLLPHYTPGNPNPQR